MVTHALEDGAGHDPITAFGIQGDERVEHDRVEDEPRGGKLGVELLTQIKLTSSDAGFEEDGVGEEVRGEASLGHEINGRDCLVEAAHIGQTDQTVLEGFEVGNFQGLVGGR